MKHFILLFIISVSVFAPLNSFAQKTRMRDLGIRTGVMQPGPLNAITDVKGVSVGHVTLIEGDSVRTGVTAIIPHPGNIFREKVPAAFWAGNGFGKLTGTTQIKELGNIETPIILTNTLSVAAGMEGLITYTMEQPDNKNVQSVNAVVGETNDGGLNDIRGRHVKPRHVLEALKGAVSGPVAEGNVGAGTGTVCFGFKGGIGTASRVLPERQGSYTVGVIVQTNFGGVLQIAGVNVGERLGRYSYKNDLEKQKKLQKTSPAHTSNGPEDQDCWSVFNQDQDSPDGSCMIVIITDAPLNERNLERLAKRGIMGLARTGGIASNGSGDYVLALSVAPGNLIREYTSATEPYSPTYTPTYLHNNECSALFMAAIEAVEEAILNSLFAAETMTGKNGLTVEALPVEKVVKMFPGTIKF
ncbi:MAG: P1 family peptidase [Bacteroidales bacterium]|jgi:D-aminopeptidase|nr:P1 family peptidase [Bacteroidales bacterium]MDD2265115.1 P1 family peptidase [Bacteroidales bacterium]MDD2832255.1 P1 family peptidase [Bacteroidales bacterium]MDD3209500.1 P1 family peptidase [Bacteroidales bacterium]MDD3698074.1 P1 family peptidase [Bacteroidales bacterium]